MLLLKHTLKNMKQLFAASMLLGVSHGVLADPAVNELPTGGQVTHGDAVISSGGSTTNPVLNIDQTSQRAIVHWNSFNVGRDATVNFNQPNASASTLNRIGGNNPSEIFGKINANGEVILQNQAGVYFSKSSSVDVGSITATTHNISDANYMSGNYHFDRNGSEASVVNEGKIKASLAGYVAMLAPEVRNAGLIVAQMGTVVMASGERVTLNFNPDRHLASITTTPATINTLIENKQAVSVNGGLIILSTKAINTLTAGVIKQSGTLNAGSEASQLVAVGGKILLQGDHVTVANHSETLAVGTKAGGAVTLNASRTLTVEPHAKIKTSTSYEGNGGSIVVNAPTINLGGQLTAQGGAMSGHGGFIHTTSDNLHLDASLSGFKSSLVQKSFAKMISKWSLFRFKQSAQSS